MRIAHQLKFAALAALISGAGLFFGADLLFADYEQNLQTITGSLTEVNDADQRINVRGQPDNGMGDLKYKDTTLDVSSALITKVTKTISLNELQSGDHVTVRFDANAQPLPKAISIDVS